MEHKSCTLFCCSPEPGIAGSAAGRTAGRHGQRGWGGRQENRPARHRGKSSLPSHHRGAQSGTNQGQLHYVMSCAVEDMYGREFTVCSSVYLDLRNDLRKKEGHSSCSTVFVHLSDLFCPSMKGLMVTL